MDIKKLHLHMSQALRQIARVEEPLPHTVVAHLRTCLDDVEEEDFPEHLQEEYRHLHILLPSVNLQERPSRNQFSPEEAWAAYDRFLWIFCVIDNHPQADQLDEQFISFRSSS